MANRRMFSVAVVCTDSFLELPCSAQALYFQLNLKADDDGFLDSPKSTARATGCTEEDLKALISANLIIAFPSGVIAITHWKTHNKIRKDRYTPTAHFVEFDQLEYDEAAEKYVLLAPSDNQMTTKCQPSDNQVSTKCQPSVNQVTTKCQPSDNQMTTPVIGIGKGTVSSISSTVTTPTKEEVYSYFQKKHFKSDPDRFFAYNSTRGWKGNWEAYAKQWEARERKPIKAEAKKRETSFDASQYWHPGGKLHPPVPDYEDQKAKRT